MSRRNTAYTKADLKRWQADMLLRQPGKIETPGLVQGVNLTSFTLGTSANGAYIIAVDQSTGPPVTILLNPVVAAALRDAITVSGRDGGWLNEDGTVVEPTRDI